MANMVLLNRVIEFVTEHPENWAQETWGVHRGDHAPATEQWCGTTACIAGWTVLLTEPDEAPWGPGYGGTMQELDSDVQEIATRLLELNEDQRNFLFHEDRTLDEIKRAVAILGLNSDANLFELVEIDEDPEEDGEDD